MRTIQTQQLSIGYAASANSPHIVAERLNLELASGEFVCLLGPNGVGKSTLMRSLSGMQPSLAGHVSLGDVRLDMLSAQDRAKEIGIVLTEKIDVGHLSAYSLVSLGRYPYTDWTGRLTDEDHRAVARALSDVGGMDLADRAVSELSDGERQKIMIARVLAQETDVIILDEPTAFLDLPRRVEIMALLRNLAHTSGKSILLSTHDLDLAVRNADRIWLMSAGEVRTGIPETLVLDGSLESAFKREGIEFDETSGAFRPTRVRGKTIGFSSSSLIGDWTGRAIERIGYEVEPFGSDSSVSLKLIDDGDAAVWTVYSDNEETFDSLDSVVGRLRELSPKKEKGESGA